MISQQRLPWFIVAGTVLVAAAGCESGTMTMNGQRTGAVTGANVEADPDAVTAGIGHYSVYKDATTGHYIISVYNPTNVKVATVNYGSESDVSATATDGSTASAKSTSTTAANGTKTTTQVMKFHDAVNDIQYTTVTHSKTDKSGDMTMTAPGHSLRPMIWDTAGNVTQQPTDSEVNAFYSATHMDLLENKPLWKNMWPSVEDYYLQRYMAGVYQDKATRDSSDQGAMTTHPDLPICDGTPCQIISPTEGDPITPSNPPVVYEHTSGWCKEILIAGGVATGAACGICIAGILASPTIIACIAKWMCLGCGALFVGAGYKWITCKRSEDKKTTPEWCNENLNCNPAAVPVVNDDEHGCHCQCVTQNCATSCQNEWGRCYNGSCTNNRCDCRVVNNCCENNICIKVCKANGRPGGQCEDANGTMTNNGTGFCHCQPAKPEM